MYKYRDITSLKTLVCESCLMSLVLTLLVFAYLYLLLPAFAYLCLLLLTFCLTLLIPSYVLQGVCALIFPKLKKMWPVFHYITFFGDTPYIFHVDIQYILENILSSFTYIKWTWITGQICLAWLKVANIERGGVTGSSSGGGAVPQFGDKVGCLFI